MAAMNIGGGGNNRDIIMVRNSITAPLHATMQVQSPVCIMIPFLHNLWFSQLCWWRFKSSGILHWADW